MSNLHNSSLIDKILLFIYNKHMAVVYFDTETTSLRPGQICQLAYIIEDKNKILPKSFYFSVNDIDIMAAKINGLTVASLNKLSSGKVLGDHIEEISRDFESAALLVAHNFNFDYCFMRVEFDRLQKVFTYREKFCSMREFKSKLRLPNKYGGYKNPSLEELATSYGVTEEEVKGLLIELFATAAYAHDARYDTCKLFLAISKARRAHGDIEELIFSKL